MKIIDVQTYRDGGTVEITTDQGKYWIPSLLGIEDKTKRIFKGENYFKRDSLVEIMDLSEIISLLSALGNPCSSYFWIKRHVS